MMPLTDRDFAEIRSNVLREIAGRERRNAFMLAASVAFAVLALVFVLVPRPLHEHQKPAGRIAGATQKPTTRRLSVAPAILPAKTVVATQTVPKKHHHHKPQPIAIASAEVPQPMTIELQTGNPDVRIIWIAK